MACRNIFCWMKNAFVALFSRSIKMFSDKFVFAYLKLVLSGQNEVLLVPYFCSFSLLLKWCSQRKWEWGEEDSPLRAPRNVIRGFPAGETSGRPAEDGRAGPREELTWERAAAGGEHMNRRCCVVSSVSCLHSCNRPCTVKSSCSSVFITQPGLSWWQYRHYKLHLFTFVCITWISLFTFHFTPVYMLNWE